MENKHEWRLLGVERLPASRDRRGVERQWEQLRRTCSSENPYSHEPVRVNPGMVCVYQDEAGDQVALIPSDSGMEPIPWVAGDETSISEGMAPASGVLTARSIAQQRAHSSKRKEELNKLIEAMFLVLMEAGLIDLDTLPPELRHKIEAAFRKQRKASRHPDKTEPHTPGGTAPQSPGANGAAQPQNTQEKKQPSELEQAATDAVPGALAGFLGAGISAGGFPPPSAFLGGLVGFLGSTLMGLGMNKVLGLLGGPPKDTDNVGKWALALLGPKLAMMAYSETLLFKELMADFEGPYQGRALRVGDKDQGGDAVSSGIATVEIEGKLAAREDDLVAGNGKAVQFGAKKVQIGGKPAGRAQSAKNPGHGSRSIGTQSPFPLPNGAKKTFFGGPIALKNPKDPDQLPPVPEEMKKDKGALPEIIKPDKPTLENMPKEATYVWDADVGEWFIWDPESGFSNTVTGYAALPDFDIILPEWLRDAIGWEKGSWADPPRGVNNWWLLGIDLGSPHWPGAGSPLAWWIPDRIFGIDMFPYYKLHDWIADFANPQHVTDPLSWLDWESQSFQAGINSTNNPIQWIFQIVYSAATSSVSIASIWNNFLDWLDQQQGYPDKYGRVARGSRSGSHGRA